jgi:hypothetical protein
LNNADESQLDVHDDGIEFPAALPWRMHDAINRSMIKLSRRYTIAAKIAKRLVLIFRASTAASSKCRAANVEVRGAFSVFQSKAVAFVLGECSHASYLECS